MISLFKRVREEILENKKLREAGKDIVLPWLRFPTLSELIPGVQRSRYIIITAASKVGKTQIADALYLMEPLEYVRKHKTNIKPKIFYFSLEMSKEDKIAQLISNKIYQDLHIVVDPDNLRSYYKNYIAEDWIIEILSKPEYDNYFEFLESHIEYIDWIKNPTGIYFYMREHARKNGKFYFKGVEVEIPEKADWSKFSYDQYVPNDPDDLVIVITDHISLLEKEKQMQDKREAMETFSSTYCLKMRDNFKFCVVNIQQQALDSDKPKFDREGKVLINELKPSTDGFGDMKLSVRDVDLVLGLFNPSKYNIPYYPDKFGYNIKEWGNHFRELFIIVNRRGGGNIPVYLYFNGAVNYFEELPAPDHFINKPNNYKAFLGQ